MPINTSFISPAMVRQILNMHEGQLCDMKAKEIAPSRLTKTLSAFANADGGEVFLGIAQGDGNQFRWVGFENIEEANAHIQSIDQLFPIDHVCRCEFIQSETEIGYILHIEVDKTADIRRASDSIAYLRRGAQNLPQRSDDEIRRLQLNKGVMSYEDQTLMADLQDIANSNAIIEFILDVIPFSEPDAWLRKQRLIVNEMPVVSGIVLFSDEPQVNLPKASIKIYRYKTNEAAGTRQTLAFDPISVEGNAYHQIFSAVARTKEITEEIPLHSVGGLQKIEYPTEAIHEIITNAVIHRDYSLFDDIHIRIFDNRIEVQSPGTLPGYVTVENILNERSSRNPKLVRILNKFKNPPNKDVGEGLNTAFEAMRNLRLKDPVVEQRDNCVVVTLRHEKLGTPEQIIVEYLKDNDEINNAIARNICFIGSENTVKRVFNKMIESGLIERIPDRPLNKTGYIKGPRFPA